MEPVPLPLSLLDLPHPQPLESLSDSLVAQQNCQRTATQKDRSFLESLQRKFSNQIGFLPAQAIDAYIEIGAYTIALENDQPAGFILSRPSLRWQPALASVTQAAVAMDAQRRHIGLALLNRIVSQLVPGQTTGIQAVCRIGLEANEFWHAAGFTPICHLRGENARKKDLIVWRMPITKKIPLWFACPPVRAGWRAQPPRTDRDPTRSVDANDFARRYVSARNAAQRPITPQTP